MQHLAYRMHDAGKHKEVDPHDAADFLQDQFRDVPAGIERIRAAERFLVQEETDSGILVSRNQTLQFWHRSFQEYLAAKALSNLEDERPRLLFGPGGKLYEGEWRETTLLLAFLLRQQNAARIDAFLKRMLDEAESGGLLEHARCAGRIGSFLRDLRVWKYQITDERFMQYMNESLVLLSDTKAVRSVDFQTRLEVADAWGLMGDPRLAEDRKWVDVGPFRMGRYPVTVQEYAEYVRAGGTAPDNWTQQLQYPNRPVVYVDWEQASGYCRSVGGRLPTSAEWELAARCGRKGDIYPWGKAETDEYKANTWETGPHHATPVGMYPEGATPSGLLDMAGNVWEWCEDWYDSDKNSKTLRGGSWNYVTRGSRVSYRSRVVPTVRDISLGFRCIGE
jgi:serine/threonine-protein kinase